jgi:hypothetical protein|tara:strand:+ start:449 stop:700 length:252 start_codon:yes stop_codon:yes gene_type:complete
MKKQAVNVLSTAYAHRNIKIHHPKDKDLQMQYFRNFRTELIKFKTIAQEVRSWDHSKKDGDVMGGILEDTVEVIDNLKEDQNI